MDCVVVPTGIGNIASMEAALSRAGIESVRTTDPDVVAGARGVVLPGVGAFGAAMDVLERDGLAAALAARVRRGGRTLAVCLGMQVFGAGSEESPGRDGLGVVDATAERFAPGLRCPHMGWNRVDGWLEGDAYFAHSYAWSSVAPGWEAAWSDHGGRFVAAARRGDTWLVQFHPELSGARGLAWIQEWWSC